MTPFARPERRLCPRLAAAQRKFEEIDHVASAVEDPDAWTARLEADFGRPPFGTNSATHCEAYGAKTGFSGRLVTLDPADTLVPTRLVEPG